MIQKVLLLQIYHEVTVVSMVDVTYLCLYLFIWVTNYLIVSNWSNVGFNLISIYEILNDIDSYARKQLFYFICLY